MFLLILNESIYSQTPNDCRYLSALLYLHTNIKVSETIKLNFPKVTNKKEKYVEFHLANRVDFIGISPFKKGITSSDFKIDEESFDNNLYYKKYFFESYRSEFLKKLNVPNESKLYLRFSKPIENYLIAELGSYDPEIYRTAKFGFALLFFFEFDSNGLIENVLYSGLTYH